MVNYISKPIFRRNYPDNQELRVSYEQDHQDKSIDDFLQYILFTDEAVLYSKLRDDLGRQSLDAGFEKGWTPKFARRGAANAANGMCFDASAGVEGSGPVRSR